MSYFHETRIRPRPSSFPPGGARRLLLASITRPSFLPWDLLRTPNMETLATRSTLQHAQPSLGIFGCKFFSERLPLLNLNFRCSELAVPIEELTSNGALGNTLAAFNPLTMVTRMFYPPLCPTWCSHYPHSEPTITSTSSNQKGSSIQSTPSPILSLSSSSLLHALDEIVWSLGTSKRKPELESYGETFVIR